MDFKPLHDRIVVETIEPSSTSNAGIIIPQDAKEKPIQGKVIAVGKGYRNEDGTNTALEIKTGDVVVFGAWAGTNVKLNKKDYLIMKESDVMLILENYNQ